MLKKTTIAVLGSTSLEYAVCIETSKVTENASACSICDEGFRFCFPCCRFPNGEVGGRYDLFIDGK